jgi:putative restriction endonuclease
LAYGVFIHRPDSIYDDTPAERYHFPRQYLSRAEACIDDWIIYYEPRKAAETRGYFAIAKLQAIVPDPNANGLYFGLIEPGTYLDFPNPIPFSTADGVIERGVLNANGRLSGRAQSAVRPISREDFDRIVALGLAENSVLLPRTDDRVSHNNLAEEQAPLLFEQNRDRSTYLTSRLLRDRAFRSVVLRAYDSRCAITGLRLMNGRGRAEVEAAHIRPVEANGPDIVSNGVALCGTAHWMFDRGLLAITDDFEVLISRQVNDTNGVRSMIHKTGRLVPPLRARDNPHPHFLRWHRENCFKA